MTDDGDSPPAAPGDAEQGTLPHVDTSATKDATKPKVEAPVEDGVYRVELSNFAGPLDLLL
ncbi:MAG: segregation/condensation protein A, partial [Myxococcota bacterium]